MKNEYWVIHHDADNDGLLSAYLAKKALSSDEFAENQNIIHLIGYDYNRPTTEIDAIPNGARVFMLDISMQLGEMITLAHRTDLTWIDHHENTYLKMYPSLSKLCQIIYQNGVSACRLTWQYFNPTQKEPRYVELLGKYDVFDGVGIDIWFAETLPFEYAVRSLVDSVDSFQSIEKGYIEALIDDGYSILGYLQKQINKDAERASIINWNGYKTLVSVGGDNGAFWYNTPRYAKEQPDLILFCYYSLETRKWKFSLRQGANKNLVDCADLAGNYGGGGHFNAAGFRCDMLPF